MIYASWKSGWLLWQVQATQLQRKNRYVFKYFQNVNVKNKHTISHNQIHIFVRFAKFVFDSHTVQRREHVHFNSSTATEQAKDEPFYLPKAWGRAGSQTGTFLPVEHTHSPTLNLKAWSNDHPLELIRNTKHKESNLPLTSR